MSLTSDDTILAFKAGRAFRTDGTNTVVPDPTKGAIIIERGEDELLHFLWKNRTTNQADEDLILFPTDASFVRVPQSDGRVYVLKFSSSNQRHFFWMQDASSQRDEEFIYHINKILEIPGYIPVWNTRPSSSQPEASTSSQAAPTSAPAGQPSQEQLDQLRSLVNQMSGGAAAPEPELSLTDILTPAVLTPLFTSHPDLIPSLFPQLPPDLPNPPSAEVLSDIIASPQFRSAVVTFDRALRTGMLAGLVRQLGLPEEAGTGAEAFLRAIAEQARREGGESMDTD
ncbi:adhesion regulating molecule [Dentipellis sp. KUC8613]|nr:adhesion regulating molecule [Dentipellis sp. KUC8613]